MSLTLANWNGKEMPLDEVRVSVTDRAFVFGDAVYEVIRVYNGKPWLLDEHLERLASGLAGLSISGADILELKKRATKTLDNSGLAEALIYMQVTRGEAPRAHHFPDETAPNVLIYVEPFVDRSQARRQEGVPCITHPDIRWARNDLKVTSLVANVLAAQEARQRDCFEAILVDAQGYVTEGTRTSIFAVEDATVLVAPFGPKVLPGITKKLVIDLCKLCQIAYKEHRLRKEELFSVTEIFLTGTTIEILPVVTVDDRPVGSGHPGEIALRLWQEFRRVVEKLPGYTVA